MSVERCWICDELTGRAGRLDDSIFDDDDNGPYCEECWIEESAKAAELEEGNDE